MRTMFLASQEAMRTIEQNPINRVSSLASFAPKRSPKMGDARFSADQSLTPTSDTHGENAGTDPALPGNRTIAPTTSRH